MRITPVNYSSANKSNNQKHFGTKVPIDPDAVKEAAGKAVNNDLILSQEDVRRLLRHRPKSPYDPLEPGDTRHTTFNDDGSETVTRGYTPW